MKFSGKIGTMSIEEKIGQMFMTRGLNFFKEETDEMIRAGFIGGMHVLDNDTAEEFEAKRNSRNRYANIKTTSMIFSIRLNVICF